MNLFDVFGGLDPQTNLDDFKNIKKTKRKYLERVLRINQRNKNNTTNILVRERNK